MESRIQSAIRRKLESTGWLVNKLIAVSKPGTPDLIAHKAGMTIYIEVKQPGRQPDPLQIHRMNELKNHGIPCIVSHSLQECIQKVQTLEKQLLGTSKTSS